MGLTCGTHLAGLSDHEENPGCLPFYPPRYVMLKMILLYGLFEITPKCF